MSVHKCTSYIYIFSDNKIGVMHRGLPWAGDGSARLAPFLHEDLLLVLLDDLLVLLFVHQHELNQLVIYMHDMMMQYLVT